MINTSVGAISMHASDVLRDLTVNFGVHLIKDDEKKIETGEQRIREADILRRGDRSIILNKF